MRYAVIVDNGGSDYGYDDVTGSHYTYPSRYVNMLRPGTNVIYYRSSLEAMKVPDPPGYRRMSDSAHYFGIAEIGSVQYVGYDNYRATIINYRQFTKAVLFNGSRGRYEHADGQFWRNGVREISSYEYDSIVRDGMPSSTYRSSITPSYSSRISRPTYSPHVSETSYKSSSSPSKSGYISYMRRLAHSESTISNYVTALESYEVSNIVRQKAGISNIFGLTNITTLRSIYNEILGRWFNEESHHTHSAAVNKYIKYINSL